jgi:hypothetical protein
VTTPLFWLGLSVLLVAICLAVVLAVAIPAFLELARAARSAEKLFDTLARDLPPTLEALRLTGLEVRELTDGLGDGVESAGRVVKQVDRSLQETKQQVQNAEITTRSLLAGAKAAWKTLTAPNSPQVRQKSGHQNGNAQRSASEPLSAVSTSAKPFANGQTQPVPQTDTPSEETDTPLS